MDFFEKLGDTIVSVSKDVTQKAKDVSGIAKLRMDIKSKEDFIKVQYQELGRAYFEENRGTAVKDQDQFDRIEEALEAIEQMERQILELKGARQCPECGAKSSDSAEYCSACGAKMSIVVDESPYEEAEENKAEETEEEKE